MREFANTLLSLLFSIAEVLVLSFSTDKLVVYRVSVVLYMFLFTLLSIFLLFLVC